MEKTTSFQWLAKYERGLLQELYKILIQLMRKKRTPFNQELKVNISDLTNKIFSLKIKNNVVEWALSFRQT